MCLKRYSNIGYVTRFELLIAILILCEIILFKMNTTQFYQPVIFTAKYVSVTV